ncbi:hypothetical protein FKW77_005333 [Venturia effusa]|uniref:F-box domain-containing protein n=1 Tax=Venturia effusa TaxID=50376 RepID=A0A517LK71_9PEZI|nr:hypothetical protein FKW77_005333 [Venturia effusa]
MQIEEMTGAEAEELKCSARGGVHLSTAKTPSTSTLSFHPPLTSLPFISFSSPYAEPIHKTTQYGANQLKDFRLETAQESIHQGIAQEKGSASSNPSRASLLGLPLELRLQILGYLLPDVPTIPLRSDDYAKIHPTSLSAAHINFFESIQRLHAGGPYPAIVQRFLMESGYKPLRQDLERSYPDILRVSRQIYSEAKDSLYRERIFEAIIDKECMALCDQIHYTPLMRGNATERRKALYENPGHLSILAPNIESLRLYLNFSLGKKCHRELKYSLCRLVNALAASGSLKHLSIIVRVVRKGDDTLEKIIEEDECSLERLLTSFDLLRNLDTSEITIQDSDDEPGSLAVSADFEEFCATLRDALCRDEAVDEQPSYPDAFLEYCRKYWYLFDEMRDGFEDQSLLNQAWRACKNGDLDTFDLISQETRIREKAVFHNKASIRLRV